MKPLDIENVLREEVAPLVAFTCIAPPLPVDFTAPLCMFARVGGSSSSLVVDTHNVMCHVYGRTWAQATDNANILVGILKELQFSSPHISRIDFQTLPYNNLDPRHVEQPRVSFTAVITARSERKDG